MLLGGLKSGHLSPSEFAVMDDWRIVSLKEPDRIGYGFLNEAKESTLATTDSIRTAIGLPSVHLRNKLVSIQEKTGMDFYLTDWIKG